MSEITELFKKLKINKPVKPLIEEAFVHSSYFYENKDIEASNERLEFIGDAVLELWTSAVLFSDPSLNEGKMTIIRAQFVCEKSFAALALKLELNKYLKLGVGEEKMGGRKKPSILADLFEAFIGALFLEYGHDYAFRFLDRKLGEEIEHLQLNKGPKNELQEYVQSDTRQSLNYELIRTSGPSNNRIFEVEVYLSDIVMGKGQGKTKKLAEQAAAKDALSKLVKK